MHKCISPSELPQPLHRHHRKRRSGGFSLIEVSMALAIVAIAFVALIGLLPAGMKVFEAAANTTAETRMVAHLSSLVQAADYTKFKASAPALASNYFYYDVDGSFVDSKNEPVAGSEQKRIYAAKILVDAQNVPSEGAVYDPTVTASKVLIVMGRNDPFVLKTLDTINTTSVITNGVGINPNTKIKVQPIIVARMDIEPNP